MNVDLLKRLADAGTPLDLIAEVAAEMGRLEGEASALHRRRKADSERQAAKRHRDGHVMSRDNRDITDNTLDKKSPHTPIKTKPNSPPLSPQKFQTAWNEMAADHGLPKIEGIGGKRLRALMARIGEHGEEAVLRAISSVSTSPHWLGANGWLGNFDSLMRPDNFQRMLEGAYATATGKSREPKTGAVPLWKHLAEKDRLKAAGGRG